MSMILIIHGLIQSAIFVIQQKPMPLYESGQWVQRGNTDYFLNLP
jgi:hypothetical protein